MIKETLGYSTELIIKLQEWDINENEIENEK